GPAIEPVTAAVAGGDHRCHRRHQRSRSSPLPRRLRGARHHRRLGAIIRGAGRDRGLERCREHGHRQPDHRDRVSPGGRPARRDHRRDRQGLQRSGHDDLHARRWTRDPDRDHRV
ncbi:MAG: hypothetical protein AVDCRST_MAG33-1699, partial [uncultured Thermomicrobiales bacterium]